MFGAGPGGRAGNQVAKLSRLRFHASLCLGDRHIFHRVLLICEREHISCDICDFSGHTKVILMNIQSSGKLLYRSSERISATLVAMESKFFQPGLLWKFHDLHLEAQSHGVEARTLERRGLPSLMPSLQPSFFGNSLCPRVGLRNLDRLPFQ